jgi:methionyl aminopeptidase
MSIKTMEREDILKAGEIAKKVTNIVKQEIKKGDKLLDIADRIEDKIIELGGFPAFPTNLSINEIAAHYTPSYNDTSIAHGLLKVDFGVRVNRALSDTAFSLDLEDSSENKALILTSEMALERALEKIDSDVKLNEVGKIIEDTIRKEGFQPIVNLSGHSMDEMELHAGITIPNCDNHDLTQFGQGLFAIEPFVTTGVGKVHDGAKGNIFVLIDTKNPRSDIAREVLELIIDSFESLPFASRWVVETLGTKALIGLKELETIGNLHHFSQLVEDSKKPIAQSEHTILIDEKGKIVTTR